jgi:hypothetical protein
LTRLSHAVPIVSGPGIAAGAILGVHGVGLNYKWEDYAAAPPTISRALIDPHIAEPFAIAMILAAFFLAIAVLQVALLLYRNIKLLGKNTGRPAALLFVVVICEMAAIAGMVVLSQFTGSVNSRLHDIGSYMLFFGHAIGISFVGYMIHGVISRLTGPDRPPGAAVSNWLALRKFPRRAGWVAILSALYGVVYFGGKFLRDAYFFWQRTVLSVLEVVVILSFLGFLVSFLPLLRSRMPDAASEDE